MKSLSEALKSNLDEFNDTFKNQNARLNSIEFILFRDVSRLPLPALDSLIALNTANFTYDPSTGIYNSIINSGKIELITNDSLKFGLSKILDRINDYKEGEIELKEFSQGYLEKFYINNFRISPEVIINRRIRTKMEEIIDREIYLKTFTSIEVKNMYTLLLTSMRVVILEGKILKKDFEGLLVQIEKEIHQKSK